MSCSGINNIETFEDAATFFRDHEGISVDSIREWSEQFGKKNQKLVLKILNNITYYSATSIREMVDELVQLVCKKLKSSDRNKILFVPIGGPYQGSAIMARALQSCRGISRKQIKNQTELATIPKKINISAIVFLDVFSGTGRQISEWWENMETLLLPWSHRSVKLILGILTLNYKAAKTLKNIPADTIYVSFLDITYNVLSNKSKIFMPSEKKLLKKYCKQTKCSPEFLYGMEECGLLVVFKHSCPNNSLPIVWYNSDRWKNIFLRRGI